MFLFQDKFPALSLINRCTSIRFVLALKLGNMGVGVDKYNICKSHTLGIWHNAYIHHFMISQHCNNTVILLALRFEKTKLSEVLNEAAKPVNGRTVI